MLDLTERKRAEAAAREMQLELVHANRVATMGQITASIAHEVKQPIAATVTNAQAALRWLGARTPDLEEGRQAIGRIVQAGKRAGAVIDRIHGLIKKAPTRRDAVDMNEAVREVIAISNSEATKNGVAVQAQLAEELPLVHGDRVQLQQVILNLMVNAIQAMGAAADGARELRITTAPAEAGSVLVRVQDSGPGMSSATIERAFDPFYTTKPGGLGMGLPICRSIVEAHGGRIWAVANVPLGAAFHFTLPGAPESIAV